MILLLDNYDSFVHNLARYFRKLGCKTLVVRSDEIDVQACQERSPEAIVISPGPGHPSDAGCSVSVVRDLSSTVPILGVCLGHQAIGLAFGAQIVRCAPVHGSASTITHDREGVFRNCPSPCQVGRYHSLAVGPSNFPKTLSITARTNDGIIMGIRHRQLPVFGVQFHPESILSEIGETVVKNFVDTLKTK
ncbi:Aminodeoxychorismate synthase component 2 [Novipirellula aureliae]|uniref:Aminodeoxychorismate synthase component 2 n=1 Tax=Novipirellula aureliae TaxID=2527966 RepID=A0A5C6DK24_9BACT|nr:aminodeoxychorismate/anthranilate synthase component II [Novipirellula aureliae]TWU37683.1 Aminodeoxychorismate synthase component 2 [Novipirellula aureliae]